MPRDLSDSNNSDYGQVFFAWQFSEFDRHQRSSNWYVWTGIGVGILLLYAILSQNFLFGLVIVLSGLMVILFQRDNKSVSFKIVEDGIIVSNKLYEYGEIENFYIIYQPPETKKLFFELKGLLSPRIPVDLVDQDPVKVRDTLRQYIDEDLEQENEPISEQFSRIFKL
jgi:hypothetical protein